MLTRSELKAWTNALRSSPEKQGKDMLANEDFTKFCCLGILCEVLKVPRAEKGYTFDGILNKVDVLGGRIATRFGSPDGTLANLDMPPLHHDGRVFRSATMANDMGVPWSVIADHFDKYYHVERDK